MKITDKYVFFWGGIFSNWNKVNNGITITMYNKTVTLPTSEHLFMWLKAMYFEDLEIADKITKTTNPKDAKILGRLVKNFNEEKWKIKREESMYLALNYKLLFDQNFKRELWAERYNDKLFVEASPYDCIWGIGMKEDNPMITNPQNWKGLNLLGKLLTKLRNETRN
jgi:ribA/ribD-fused uncharacterized protein